MIPYRPLDPMDSFFVPLPDDLTGTEREQYQRQSRHLLVRATVVFLVMLCALVLSLLLTGCSTIRESSTSVERHRMETLMERMDSVIGSRTVVQQDSTWRETILRQFQSIREKSDTSHTLVVDTAGRVIKETTIINNTKEIDSSEQREEREVLIHRLSVMDSTLSVMRQQLSHTDSLLQAKETTEVIEQQQPWWQRLWDWLGQIALLAAVIYVLWQFVRIKILKK